MRTSTVVAVVAGGLLLAGCGAGDPVGTPAPFQSPATATAAPAPLTTTPPAVAGIPEGTWIVGVDVQPGTYRTRGATREYVNGLPLSVYCMWSRQSQVGAASGEALIASDGSRDGQLTVTIEPGDKQFLTRGCHPWERIG